MRLSAGVSRQSINPQSPLTLFGYPHTPRISTGIHDPLYATALYLDNGNQAIVLISVDVLMLDHVFLNHCRQEISKQTGVPTSHILISTTHTHSAPITMEIMVFQEDQYVSPPDSNYMSLLQTAIIDSAIGAFSHAKSSLIAVTSASINGVGKNRHSPDGPRDPEAGILAIKSLETGQISALYLIYSMHPTVLHEDSTLVSADFPGLARSALEKHFRGAIVLYHNGPCGNLSPRYDVTGQTFAEADRLGNSFAESITQAVLKIQTADFLDQAVLKATQQWLSLPRRIFPGVEEAKSRLKKAREHYQALVAQGAPHGPTRTAEVSVFGAEEMVLLSSAQQSGELEKLYEKYRKVETQVIRIGSTYLAALQGEIFVEYALEIKRKAQQRVFAISLANGELQGYIVTPDAAGYEADFSLFSPESGKMMVEASLSMISSLNHDDEI
jgi:neutral ceramidase